MSAFLSVVMVVQNQSSTIRGDLGRVARAAQTSGAADYELIVVDNGSSDDSLVLLREITSHGEVSDVQVYGLASSVDYDTAAWTGVERALGDFVVILDLLEDDISQIPAIFARALAGNDVVFARNETPPKRSILFRWAQRIFHGVYKSIYRVELEAAPRYRLLSREVVNTIQSQHQPVLSFRHALASRGYRTAEISFRFEPRSKRVRNLQVAVQQGVRLLVADSAFPLRLVVGLSLLGACANLVYSIYVIAVSITNKDVVAGWTSLSLQLSMMFFLLSAALFVLAEYLLHLLTMTNTSSPVNLRLDFISSTISRRDKLNVEDAVDPAQMQNDRK